MLVVSEGRFLKKQVAFYDLFRIENSKIVERWDTIEEIPAKESRAPVGDTASFTCQVSISKVEITLMNLSKVLIAEDDYRVSGIWKEFTEKVSGFKVVKEVRDGKAAFEFVSTNQVDLLIMDIYMPEMDGLGLIHKIRKNDIPIEVLVISAAKETEMIQRFLRMGAFDYIIKPCVFERFNLALGRFSHLRKHYENSEMDQAALDSYFYGQNRVFESEERDLPKGLQRITLEKINQFFDENPFSQSADEISGKTGLSIATVQRYLRYLTQEEELKKELTYGSKGRPEHKYSLI